MDHSLSPQTIGDVAAPGQRKRESRKLIIERIRQAAVAEFSQHGLRGASTQSIAERAGLSRPQLHYYIPGKEELYEELLGWIVGRWESDTSFDHASDDPRKVLTGYIHNKIDQAMEEPELTRLFGLEMLSGAPNLGKYWPKAVAITESLAATINRWIAEGKMRPVNAHLLLMNIWAMTSYYTYTAAQVDVMAKHAPGALLGREAIRQEITDLVLRGCGVSLD